MTITWVAPKNKGPCLELSELGVKRPFDDFNAY